MADEETQISDLKTSLRNWREVLLPVSSVLLWEKHWYPGAIIGGTSIFFMSVWLLDPSFLTTFSIFGLTITISDYVVPLLAASMMKAELWSEKKEKQFEEVCRLILRYYYVANARMNAFYELRVVKPRMYYGCTIVALILMAWIGNNINNLFLSYILVSMMLLVPGMERTGVISTYSKYLADRIAEMASSTKMMKGGGGQLKKD